MIAAPPGLTDITYWYVTLRRKMAEMTKNREWATMRGEQSDDGFTLVEILVVIIIIGILAAIAIPIYLNQRQAARDASIITDARNAGTQMTDFLDGKTADEIGDIVGRTTGVEVSFGAYGEGRAANNSNLDWNTHDDFPTLALSPASHVTVTMVRPNNNPKYYPTAQPGDFCLSADNTQSSYNFTTPGVLGPANYDKLVFYDVQLGGVKFMDDLVAAVKNGDDLSCRLFAQRYIDAGGAG